MKKLLCLAFSLMLLCACALAETDLSGMTYAELVALRDKINLAMWNSQEWQEVTVPQGVWLVGEDIPEGHWTIKCAGGYSCSIETGTLLNDTGREIDYMKSKNYFYDIIHYPESYIFNPASDKTEIDLKLKAGTYIVIDNASAIFTPYAGKPSLGFK